MELLKHEEGDLLRKDRKQLKHWQEEMRKTDMQNTHDAVKEVIEKYIKNHKNLVTEEIDLLYDVLDSVTDY